MQPELLGAQLRDGMLDLQQLLIQPAQIVQRRRRCAGTIGHAGSFRVTHFDDSRLVRK
jgi:hypothetical protein